MLEANLKLMNTLGSYKLACRKQQCLVQSTVKVEYIALTEACKEAVDLKTLLNEIEIEQEQILIQNDNQAAIKLCHHLQKQNILT